VSDSVSQSAEATLNIQIVPVGKENIKDNYIKVILATAIPVLLYLFGAVGTIFYWNRILQKQNIQRIEEYLEEHHLPH